MKNIITLSFLYLITGCAGSYIQPQYKVELGCPAESEHYQEERKQVVNDQGADHHDIDCPTDQQSGHPY